MLRGVRSFNVLLTCKNCAKLQSGNHLTVSWGQKTQRSNSFISGVIDVVSGGATSKRKEYSERRLLGYSMDQMYNVVVDVERYVEFVPWCKRSDIVRRQANSFQAELTVGFPPIEESYKSLVSYTSPYLVKSICSEGKLFNHLVTIWRFRPGLPENPQSCILDFSVSFEFRSRIHSQFAHIFFDQVVVMMVSAFLKRATALHGPESIRTQKPKILAYAR